MTEIVFDYAVVILASATAYWIVCDARGRLFGTVTKR